MVTYKNDTGKKRKKSKVIFQRILIIIASCLISASLIILYTVFIEPNRIIIEHQTLSNPGFGSNLKDFHLLHLSDLHIKKIGYREKRLISKVNQIEADLIVITGDFSSKGCDLKPCLDVLRSFKKPKYGIFSILGNEDYSYGNVRILQEKLHHLGIDVLVNEHCRIDVDGKSIYLIGVDSIFFNRSDLDKAMAGLPSNSPVILLAHSPDIVLSRGDGLKVSLFEKNNMGLRGWGWQDGQYSKSDGNVYFANDGEHTLRIQRREDGIAIDQIVLSYQKYLLIPPGEEAAIEEIHNDPNEILIKMSQVAEKDIHGDWKKYRNPKTNGNIIIADMPDNGDDQLITLLEPEHYFEVQFNAQKGKKYHIWLRMKANKNSTFSDSVYLQFSDSVDAFGKPIYQIGSLINNQNLKRIDLVLCGHTHGGQVCLPFIGAIKTLSSLGNRYSKGLYEINGTKLYINRGIGMSILPVRFLCPPEITLFSFN